MSSETLGLWPNVLEVQPVILSGDKGGAWTLSSDPDLAFSNPQAAIDFVRRTPCTRRTMIEVWQGHQYICCLMPGSTLDNDIPRINTYAQRARRSLSLTIECYVNRAAPIGMNLIGLIFWFAIGSGLIAATYGLHSR